VCSEETPHRKGGEEGPDGSRKQKAESRKQRKKARNEGGRR
jgi:hypothetical protein